MGKVVTVELDEATSVRLDDRLEAGGYGSLSETLEAALDALDRERIAQQDPAETARIKALVQEALDDPRPALPIDEAFAEIEEAILAHARERSRG